MLLFAVGALAVGSGVGYVYATQVVFPLPEGHADEYREVPDLRGLSPTEAETILRERGLQIGTVDSISHPDRAPGLIVGQDPLPGQLAIPEGEVALTLSAGPERRTVPDVSRMRADRAATVLETTGFRVAVDSLQADIPAGRVVSTFPEAGEDLSLPAVVRLMVSVGPPEFPMPGLIGLEEDEARLLLGSLGLAVGEVEARLSFFRGGEVLDQFPLPDSLVAPGTEVRLVIGRLF